MDNPLKRKNEPAADTADGGVPEPAGSGIGEGESHRTAGKPTTEPVGGSAGAAGAVGSGGADARNRSADRAAGSPAEASPDGRTSTGPQQGSAASEAAERDGAGASRAAAPAVSSAPTTSGAPEASGASGTSGATTAVPAQSAQSARGPADGRPAAGGAEADEQGAALFSPEDAEHLQQRWRDVQSDFVDDPRSAVDSADRLVDEMLRTLNERLAARKQTLEEQWSGGSDSGTEDLRTTMRGYRAFFRQLLDGSRG